MGQKPQRFVDLLAQGVEFIRDYNNFIWRVHDGAVVQFWDVHTREWQNSVLCTEVFKPATPAENPEKQEGIEMNTSRPYSFVELLSAGTPFIKDGITDTVWRFELGRFEYFSRDTAAWEVGSPIAWLLHVATPAENPEKPAEPEKPKMKKVAQYAVWVIDSMGSRWFQTTRYFETDECVREEYDSSAYLEFKRIEYTEMIVPA